MFRLAEDLIVLAIKRDLNVVANVVINNGILIHAHLSEEWDNMTEIRACKTGWAAVQAIWIEFENMSEKTNIYSLPNEILSKIVHLAATKRNIYSREHIIDHGFLVDVISKVSTRFKDIASDP